MKKLMLFVFLAVLSCTQKPKKEPDMPSGLFGKVTKPVSPEGKQHKGNEKYTYIDTDAPFETVAVTPNKKAGAPFNTMDYDNVILYDFEGSYVESRGEDNGIIRKDGSLHPAVLKRVALTQQQVDYLTEFLTDKDTYGSDGAACFEPRMGLVFYKGKKVVMYISICLSCNVMDASIDIPARKLKTVKEGGDEIPLNNFSEEATQKMEQICSVLGFHACRQ